MLSTRFNLIEKLNIVTTRKSFDKTSRSFDKGDIPDVFRKMYNLANSLASEEGLVWIQVKHAQDIIDRMQERESSNSANRNDELLPPLLQTQLLDFVNERREYYMQRMTQLLELYAKSKWVRKDE